MNSRELGYYTNMYKGLNNYHNELKNQQKNHCIKLLEHYTPYNRGIIKKYYKKCKDDYDNLKEEYIILNNLQPEETKHILKEIKDLKEILNKCHKVLLQ